MTPNSSLTPYISAQDFLARVDNNLVGMLVRDDSQKSSTTELLTDPNLAACLADASGKVEAACVVGARYTVQDLQSLTGNSLAYLKRICTFIAVWYLHNRRPSAQIPPMILQEIDDAQKALDDISAGKNVFSFIETEQAGLTQNQFIDINTLLTLPYITNNARNWGLIRSKIYPFGSSFGGFNNQ